MRSLVNVRTRLLCLNLSVRSEEHAKRFLHNVASVLRPGGLFIGFMPDPEAIWIVCQKRCTGEMCHCAAFGNTTSDV